MKQNLNKIKDYWKRSSSDLKYIAVRTATIYSKIKFKTHLKNTGYFFLTIFVVILAIPLFPFLLVIPSFGRLYDKILKKILKDFELSRKPISDMDKSIKWE